MRQCALFLIAAQSASFKACLKYVFYFYNSMLPHSIFTHYFVSVIIWQLWVKEFGNEDRIFKWLQENQLKSVIFRCENVNEWFMWSPISQNSPCFYACFVSRYSPLLEVFEEINSRNYDSYTSFYFKKIKIGCPPL